MFEGNLVRAIVAFLVVLAVGLYLYTAMNNKKEVMVDFMGNEKKISVRSLILICFLDGILLGIAMGYLLFKI